MYLLQLSVVFPCLLDCLLPLTVSGPLADNPETAAGRYMYGNALVPGMWMGLLHNYKVFTQKTINHVTAAVHCV